MTARVEAVIVALVVSACVVTVAAVTQGNAAVAASGDPRVAYPAVCQAVIVVGFAVVLLGTGLLGGLALGRWIAAVDTKKRPSTCPRRDTWTGAK